MKALREYLRAESPQEAVTLKKQYGRKADYLAGGSDILVHRRDDVEALIDIRHAGIDYVRRDDDAYVIGGAALLRDAERLTQDVAGGMLRLALRSTAPWLIRNAATVSGNIANASPAADSVPALLVLDAELALLDEALATVPIGDIFEGPHRTNLGDQLIKEIRIPAEAASRRGVFLKHSRSKSDIAQVNLAVTLDVADGVIRNPRIALGAVGPTPLRASRAESLLRDEPATPGLLAEVEREVRDEVRPITDWRATEEYRRRMSGVLVRRAIEQLVGAGEERRTA